MKRLLVLMLTGLAGLVPARADETVKLNLVSPQDYQVFQRQTEAGGWMETIKKQGFWRDYAVQN